MKSRIATRLRRSQQAFLTLVWPRIQATCGGGNIIPVESVSAAEFTKQLDTLSGIDAWQQLTDQDAGDVLRGIATRVQWTNDPYDTFTIRRTVASGLPTEYDKRLAALNGRGFLYPHLTVQAFIDVDNQTLLSVGIAKTEALIRAVSQNRWRPNKRDGSTFYVVPFTSVEGARVRRAHKMAEAPHA